MIGAPLIFLGYGVILIVIAKIFELIGINIIASTVFTLATINIIVVLLYFVFKTQGTFPEFVQGIDDIADYIRSNVSVCLNLKF